MLGIGDMMNKIGMGFCCHGAHLIVRATHTKKTTDKIKTSYIKVSEGNKQS